MRNNIEEESDFLFAPVEEAVVNSGLPTDRFSALTPLYESEHGPIRLHVASRYGRRYVLKSLKAEDSGNSFYRTAIRKEFEIGIALDHPNVRRTLGFEHVDGIGEAIVLEYVDGISLDEAMRTGRVTRDNLREICLGIAAALEYLHSKQIVHRDLKPSNIMLTHGGNVVKLIDFSMADGGEYTMLKIPGGTRGWMAPEQQRANAEATVEGDIYSFGRILADLAKAAGGDAPLERLAARCCASDPGNRPHSVRQLALENLPSAAHSPLASPKLTVGLLAILALLCFL